MSCPLCKSPLTIVEGSDGRRYKVCSDQNCRHNYSNQSRSIKGRARNHFKLTKEDYVIIHEDADDTTIGGIAFKWGISRRQVKRILGLNLSRYAERVYGEQASKPLNMSAP